MISGVSLSYLYLSFTRVYAQESRASAGRRGVAQPEGSRSDPFPFLFLPARPYYTRTRRPVDAYV